MGHWDMKMSHFLGRKMQPEYALSPTGKGIKQKINNGTLGRKFKNL